jgi:hypothetical protein
VSPIREHDRVVLTADVPEENLVAGDVGTVVHLWKDGTAFDVELFPDADKISTVVTVPTSAVRLAEDGDDLSGTVEAAKGEDLQELTDAVNESLTAIKAGEKGYTTEEQDALMQEKFPFLKAHNTIKAQRDFVRNEKLSRDDA